MTNNTAADKETSEKMNGKPDPEVEKMDDPIISDVEDGSLPDIACDTCDIEFPNVKSYEAHLKGRKHQKMLTHIKLKKKVLDSNKASLEGEDDNEEDVDEELSCDICEKSFSGYIPYALHLKGSGHKKNAKKQKLMDELKDMPEVLKKEDGQTDSDEDEILKSYAKCGTCNKAFSGPEPFRQHIKSSIHKKKVSQQKVIENMKATNETNDEDNEEFARCETCNKSFSGPVPYHIHMKSAVHQKEMKKLDVIKKIQEFCLEDSDGSNYVCKECKKKFCNPLAFESHLTNNDHEKQKARMQIASSLSAYPELMTVKPDKICGSSEDEGELDTEQDSFWICKICHVSFSGPENARDHVKSKRHLNIKMELKQKKLLKARKVSEKSSSVVESVNQNGHQVSNKTLPSSVDGVDKSDDLNEEFELI